MTDREKFEGHFAVLDASIKTLTANRRGAPGEAYVLRDICEWIAKEEGRREQVSGQPAGTRTS